MVSSITAPPIMTSFTLCSNLVAGTERVEVLLGLRCQRPMCVGQRSLIPHDIRVADNVIEVLCPCGSTRWLSIELPEEELLEEGEACALPSS